MFEPIHVVSISFAAVAAVDGRLKKIMTPRSRTMWARMECRLGHNKIQKTK